MAELLPALYWQRMLYRAHRDRPYTENIVVQIHISGDWRLTAAELALRRLVARHESLRVVFVVTSNGLAQQVLPLDAFMSMFRITKRYVKGGTGAAATEVHAISRHAFKITEAPLLRAAIVVAADGDAVVLLVVNHAVTDGWSMGVLVRDLIELYREASGGGRARLPDVRRAYSEYARRYGASKDDVTAVDHWARTLGSPVPPLRLPLGESKRGWRLEPIKSLPAWTELAAVAAEENISPARLLQTLAVASLLPFAEGTIEVGIVDANRVGDGLRDAVGCMHEILPVRVAVREQCSIRELAAGLSASLRQARACRVPFGAITAELSDAIDPPRSLPDYRVTINVLPPTLADPDHAVAGPVIFRPKPVGLVMEGSDEWDDPGVDVALDYVFWGCKDRPSGGFVGGSASASNAQSLRRLVHALVRLGPQALSRRDQPVGPLAVACWERALAAFP